MLQAIGDLPEDEREAFDLVRIQGMTQVEAAEVLGVSIKTVQRRLNRGLLILAEELDDLRPDGESPRKTVAIGCRLVRDCSQARQTGTVAWRIPRCRATRECNDCSRRSSTPVAPRRRCVRPARSCCPRSASA